MAIPARQELETGQPTQREEGRLTKTIERETSKLPSISFLGLAGASVAVSLYYKMRGQNTVANFIGLWVPSILLLGIYNKLVKLEGSDARSRH